MSDKTIILCPGQGAQAVGMGQAWFDAIPVAAQTFAAADEALGFSLTDLCFRGPAERLNRTDVAQCAIYVTSVACYQALLESETVGSFDATAGLSLGEFTALHLAGAYDFVEGLRLVRLRGEAMQVAAEASGGTMVAVTGDVSEDAINELCDRARGGADDVLVPANFNSPMQVVVSGSAAACERAVGVAGEMGFKPTPLTVAGAFHSPLMQPAAERLAAALDAVQWNTPNADVIANVTARPHEPSVEGIKARLVEQLTQPVRWTQSMQWAVANLSADGGRYVELAPGKVLSGLMRRIDRGTKVENFNEPK
ncbi:MAG: ACP S-malonyltransferase [Planctomycetota bacterium]